VQATGDVWPANDRSTPNANEGLPFFGNDYDDDLDPDMQEDWETDKGVVVGRIGRGTLQIDGGSILRYEHLIIGGDASGTTRAENDPGDPILTGTPSTTGNGTVIITSIGSAYSNNTNLDLWPELPEDFVNDPMRDTEVGYDMYVGLSGSGELYVNSGGYVDIQDGIGVGYLSTGIGNITVDGIGSLIQNGGFLTASAMGQIDLHHFSVGENGSGTVRILNGGRIISLAPQLMGSNEAVFGAAIGGVIDDVADPDPGGDGYVLVDGANSQWIIGGGMRLGAFAGNVGQMPTDPVIKGTNVNYDSDVGKGTLVVSNGGKVTLTNPDPLDVNAEVQFLIGGRGRLELHGGTVVVGTPVIGNPPERRPDTVVLVNDGVITGSGLIETGVFRNRYYGKVLVNPGEHLTIASTSQFVEVSLDFPPLNNWGIIEVNGGEFEIQRANAPNPAPNGEILQPFVNLRADPIQGGRLVGLISAKDATLRFQSGLLNEGVITFSGDSILATADVLNTEDFAFDIINRGFITLQKNTNLEIQSTSFLNDALLEFTPSTDVAGSSLQTWGDVALGPDSFIRMVVGGGTSSTLSSHFSAGDDLVLDGRLEVELTGSFQEGDVFEIMSSAGPLSGMFTSFAHSPSGDPDLFLFPFYDYLVDTVSLMSFSVANAIGADFNGDGIVDSTDLAIWQAFLGTPGPAGDANLDGIVNGDDFLIWDQQVGGMGMMPGAGAGAGSGASLAGVPEPSAMTLLATSLLALAALRRRRTS
jgi:hypothetical protein